MDDQIPDDNGEARKVIRESSKYTLIGQHLYKRGFTFPLLRCMDEEEVEYIIREVHEGICRTHIGGQALASKIARVGYYWPMLRSDCMNYVKKCDKCQRVDILGPFSITPGQVKFFIVAVDYFTKKVEAESVATISSDRTKHFFWEKNHLLIRHTGRDRFASRATTEFCEGLKIMQLFMSVEHPQSNGQAEATNKVILRGLQKRLEEANGRWAEELPQVLWSYHTTPHSTTNETPFRLTFGTEVMIPMEIGELSPRTALFELGENKDELRVNMDMLQEIREIAHVREYAVKARAARKYDKIVVPCSFKLQDLVLRREGPFKVIKEVGRGAYRLEILDGKKIPRT
ncbi:hypothetical protein CR513_17643, partial [Mucuna pruriens]